MGDGTQLRARMLRVRNPATGAVLREVANMGAADAEAAVGRAAAAMASWRARTATERADVVWRVHELLQKQRREIAELVTAESGKPLAEGLWEVDYSASYFRTYAELVRHHYGQVIPSPMPDRRLVVVQEPVGVCALIST
jgi:succinate-semialdehyde dehydrogenase/glutarate-semialdehyde dehydrogenase